MRLAVVGLGYVGLPLATAFSVTRKVWCLDSDKDRLEELRNGVDSTNEVEPKS